MSTRDFNPPDLDTAQTLVGRGWWPLLERVYELAEAEGIVPLQIKEKGGGLRVAWAPEDVRRIGRDKLYGLSQELESESYRRCEACGEPGEPVQARGRGDWRKVLCSRHAEMRRAGAMWHEIMGMQPFTTPMEGEVARDRVDGPLDVSGFEVEEHIDVLGVVGESPEPGETEDEEEGKVRLGPIRRHPQVCHGNLTFVGSRVWVDSLFGYLKEGASLDEWLEDFPSVSRRQAQATLELALEILETISAEPQLREAVWRADLDLGALLDEDWPWDPQ